MPSNADQISAQAAPLRAIETQYRGYRFRSRTEACWAVWLDAAGITWQYEPEGYELGGGMRYLPDFFLPHQNVYLEVKPTKAAAEAAAPTLAALAAATGAAGVFAVDRPTIEPPDQLFNCYTRSDGTTRLYRADVWQCVFCDQLHLSGAARNCTDIPILSGRSCRPLRLNHALGEGQRARFEFGESGRPRPYMRPPAQRTGVYMAGPIFDRAVGCEVGGHEHNNCECTVVAAWRGRIFRCTGRDLRADAGTTVGRFTYAGPTIFEDHGIGCESLANECLDEVAEASTLFAWIDRDDTIGTLVEIGAAYTARKPIFIAFADDQLAQYFYFAKQLASIAVVTPDVMAAWALFARANFVVRP